MNVLSNKNNIPAIWQHLIYTHRYIYTVICTLLYALCYMHFVICTSLYTNRWYIDINYHVPSIIKLYMHLCKKYNTYSSSSSVSSSEVFSASDDSVPSVVSSLEFSVDSPPVSSDDCSFDSSAGFDSSTVCSNMMFLLPPL